MRKLSSTLEVGDREAEEKESVEEDREEEEEELIKEITISISNQSTKLMTISKSRSETQTIQTRILEEQEEATEVLTEAVEVEDLEEGMMINTLRSADKSACNTREAGHLQSTVQ